jgi:hypothetical protein
VGSKIKEKILRASVPLWPVDKQQRRVAVATNRSTLMSSRLAVGS